MKVKRRGGTMGMYKRMENSWKRKNNRELWKERIRKWRKEKTIKRIDRPTRLDKARRLGYKAKQGYILARVRIRKGGRKRPKPSGGRKPRKSGIKKFTPGKSKRGIAEERAHKKFKNLEVLNSYYLTKDGEYKWYEVILVDPDHPRIKKDPKINWICSEKRRAQRGKTSAGKKSRGLGRGKGKEKR